MKYKKLFKSILNYFEYEYFSCNIEEIISLKDKKGITFEISIESYRMAIVVENNFVRENYNISKFLTESEKEEISRIIESIYDTKTKLKQLNLFFEKYIKNRM